MDDFDTSQTLMAVVFAVVAIAGIVLATIAAGKRRKELAAWAAARRLTFSPVRAHGFGERLRVFPALLEGENRYAENVMGGTWAGRELCAFDYHYETYTTDSHGRRQTSHTYFSCVLIDSRLPLKPLFIRPEHFFDKVAEFFGADDIDFESNDFSRKFFVKAPDKKWAFDVIHQKTMEFLLSAPRFTIQFAGPGVLAWRQNRFSTLGFEGAAATVSGILDMFPEYLLQELKGAAT